MARILQLPTTPAGREALRDAVRMTGGWDAPDGSRAEDIDWDDLAIEVERMVAETTDLREVL